MPPRDLDSPERTDYRKEKLAWKRKNSLAWLVAPTLEESRRSRNVVSVTAHYVTNASVTKVFAFPAKKKSKEIA